MKAKPMSKWIDKTTIVECIVFPIQRINGLQLIADVWILSVFAVTTTMLLIDSVENSISKSSKIALTWTKQRVK